MRLTKDNIVVRSATVEDAILMNQWWNDGRVMEHAGFPYGVGESLEETIKNIKSRKDESGQLCIIEIDGKAVGELSYRIEDNTAYPGWKICDFDYQNKGYGTKIILLLFEYLFNFVDRIVWDTMIENTRAQHVYERKIGARRVGTRENCWKDQTGKYRTAVDYEMTKEEFLVNRKKDRDFFDLLIEEEKKHFEGWDFSYLESTNRMQEFPLSWNYWHEVEKRMNRCSSLLDMGTGGGEFLSSLAPLPKIVCATEGYEPNIPIARKRLEPLGVKVYKVDSDENLPFDNYFFDLVINRHESYSEKEVHRVLKKGGVFVTQQVGGLNDKEINELLGVPLSEYVGWNLIAAVARLKENGFNVTLEKEEFVKTRFYDVGAIVFYLKAIPWQVPNFTIKRYLEKLKDIDRIIQKDGYIDFTCHRFLVVADKKQ